MGRCRWLVAVPVVGPVVTFATALAGRRLIAPGDAFLLQLPRKELAARMVGRGHLPVWNAFAFSGFPLLAGGQESLLYPPTWLFLVLPEVVANNVAVVSTFAVAGVGGFLLGRRLCADAVGATVTGVAFGLSGFLFAQLTHQSIAATTAWLPWLFYGFDLLCERFTARRLLVAGGSLGLAVLAGHGQMIAFLVLVLGLYALALALLELRRSRGRPLLVALVVVVVGCALGAAQLLPTLAISSNSGRTDVPYEEATSFAMPGSHTPLLVFPYLFGNAVPAGPFTARYNGEWNLPEMSSYVGVVALAFAAVGLRAARRDRRAVALVAVGAIAFVIALGDLTPLGRAVYALPVYGQFRAWARYLVVVDLAVAVLAGYGVAELRRAAAARRPDPAVWLPAAAAAGLVVVAAMLLPALSNTRAMIPSGDPGSWALFLPCAVAVGGAACCLLFLRVPRVAGAVAVVAIALDSVFAFGAWFEWRHGSPTVEQWRTATSPSSAPDWGPVNDAPGGLDRYALLYHDFHAAYSRPHPTDLKGLRSVNGDDSLAPGDYLEALQMEDLGTVERPDLFWRQGSHVLDILRVSTVLVDRQSLRAAPPPDSQLIDPAPGGRTGLLRYAHQPRLPDAYLVGESRRVTRASALRMVVGEGPFDPSTTAAIDQRCDRCRLANRPGSAGTVSARRFGDGSVTLDVAADRSAMVVVSQAWFPGWHATVDGDPAPVVRANALVQAVPVGAGRHRVELRYRAPGLRTGVAISLAALAMLLIAALAERRRRGLTGQDEPHEAGDARRGSRRGGLSPQVGDAHRQRRRPHRRAGPR